MLLMLHPGLYSGPATQENGLLTVTTLNTPMMLSLPFFRDAQ
jgi:hypothetical protein